MPWNVDISTLIVLSNRLACGVGACVGLGVKRCVDILSCALVTDDDCALLLSLG